jgi:hypothetical protein
MTGRRIHNNKLSICLVGTAALYSVKAFAPRQTLRRFPVVRSLAPPNPDDGRRDNDTATTDSMVQLILSDDDTRMTLVSNYNASGVLCEALSDDDDTTSTPQLTTHSNNDFVKAWFSKQGVLFFGIQPTPEILAICTIYFVQGAVGLARLAQTYLLKDELHLGPAELSALTGIFVLPWTIKPLYGFLSDGFPLFGYKRKSYLMLAGVLGGLSYTLLGMTTFWEGLSPSTSIAGTIAALLVSSASIAMCDVVADGIVVTKTRASSSDPAIAGGLQSLCWGSAALGGLLSAYFSGSLLTVMSVREVFGLTAILPLLVALIALSTEEEPLLGDDQEDNLLDGVKDQVDALWGALRQPSIWRPALFLFLWQSTPTADGAFFFFLSNDLGLGPECKLNTSFACYASLLDFKHTLTGPNPISA